MSYNKEDYEYHPQGKPDEAGESPNSRVLPTVEKHKIEEEVKKEKNRGLIQQLSGALSALLLFLGTLNIEFEWFTQDSINAFVLFVGAASALGVSLYTVYKNSYAGKKAQEDNRRRKEAQKAEELIEKDPNINE